MKRVHVITLQVLAFFAVAAILLHTLATQELVSQSVARVHSVLSFSGQEPPHDAQEPRPGLIATTAFETKYVTVSETVPSRTWSNTWPVATYPPANAEKTPDPERETAAESVVRAVFDPDDTTFEQLECRTMSTTSLARYGYLRGSEESESYMGKRSEQVLPKYFFALDLYNCRHILPRLLASIIQAIDFLGPQNCFLSIIEGRSNDGTFEALNHPQLRAAFEDMHLQYRLGISNVNPTESGHDRIAELANLRNQALDPVISAPESFDDDTVVLFINDVSLCQIDILEMVHKKQQMQANQVCAMDWDDGKADFFYDVWIARQINGETFFEIAQDGQWTYADNLFWTAPETRARYDRRAPFQVFSCWNGITIFDAAPFTRDGVRFRSAREHECYLGEPVHMDKDFWARGYGRIAVVPNVNVGYNDQMSMKVKEQRGTVEEWYEREGSGCDEVVEWIQEPPKLIKCFLPGPEWKQKWVAWDQSL